LTERGLPGRWRAVLDARLRHVRCAIEAVHQRHNAAAVIRTCEALGVHRVHLVGLRGTPAWRATRGALQWVETVRHDTAEEAIEALDAAGVDLWVADLAEGGLPPEQVPLERPVCLWLGAEMVGVSDTARRAASGVVTLPMHGFSQSLNVSVAAALALRPLAERARALGAVARLTEDERADALALWNRA
jgi:tRNA (guanosine-2'-O-)-methyltransferase